MGMKLDGTKDLKNDLLDMAEELEFGRTVNKALRQGAEPIESQMLKNAGKELPEHVSVITGTLRGSIHTGKVKKRREGGKTITIGVHSKEKGAYYANPVEFGHGGPAPAPAHPFVRPAFDTRADEAYELMKSVLRSAIK